VAGRGAQAARWRAPDGGCTGHRRSMSGRTMTGGGGGGHNYWRAVDGRARGAVVGGCGRGGERETWVQCVCERGVGGGARALIIGPYF
jgi:hypothetical protein